MIREMIEYLGNRPHDTLAVATIVWTQGSTPRKAGVSMVVHPNGTTFGTIGCGRAEYEIRATALDVLQHRETCRRIRVSLDDDEAVKEGMVCGGRMDVWISAQYE